MKLLFILLLGLGFTQTKLETRVYQIENFFIDNHSYDFNWNDIVGSNINDGIVQILSIKTDDSIQNNSGGEFSFHDGIHTIHYEYDELGDFIRLNSEYEPIFISEYLTIQSYNIWDSSAGNFIIKFAVTAEFPEEDTGYIEDGFEFCLTPGANLLSFPCDSPINVGESLPQGVENFITEIVGQGVAASYNPALGWIGNLAEFTPGSGYWFKSNESLCFEYDCVED